MGHGGGLGEGKKWIDSGYVLVLELSSLAYILHKEDEDKKIKNDSWVFLAWAAR